MHAFAVFVACLSLHNLSDERTRAFWSLHDPKCNTQNAFLSHPHPGYAQCRRKRKASVCSKLWAAVEFSLPSVSTRISVEQWSLESKSAEAGPRLLDKRANLQHIDGRSRIGSGLFKRRSTSAHASRWLLTRHLKTCSLVTLFTKRSSRRSLW